MAKKTTAITDLGEKIGGARKDMAVATGPRVTKPKVVDDTPAWARRYKPMQELDYKTKQPIGTWSLVDFDKNSRFGGRTIARGLSSEADAISKIPLAAVSRNHTVRAVNTNAKPGEMTFAYEIWRKVTDRKQVKVVSQQFASRDEAMTHMAQNAQKIIETKTGFGEEILAKPDIAKRVGPAVRPGDIAGEAFMKTLGMRGVEFGNWQGDRQHVMNHAFDAFQDLGHVTGIDPRDLSLKSDLGIAFGARGHGLSSARAHYEPDYGAINLTKMEGAGALAHEWFHALDHMLGRVDDPKLAEKIDKGGAKVYKHASGDGVFASHRVSGYAPQKQLSEPVRAAYKGLMDALYHKEEKYTEDAAKVQKFSERTQQNLADQIKGIRSDLTRELTYGKRNTKPATEAQLAEFDKHASQILSGEALKTEWKDDGKVKRNRFSMSPAGRRTNDALEGMSAVIKKVRGISGFNSEQKGWLDRVRQAMSQHSDRLALVKESEAQTVKTRKIPTEFSREAHKLDEGRVQDYWQTKHEMAARAFSAYVEDKLKSAGRQSDYLSYGSENWHYIMTGAKPFPEGEERAAINAKFDDLFKAMRESGVVRPAGAGVNLGWSDQARAASLAVRQDNAASKAPIEIAKAAAPAEPAKKTPKPPRVAKAKPAAPAAEMPTPAAYTPQVGDAVHAKNAASPYKIENLSGSNAEIRKFNPTTRKWSAKTFNIPVGKIIGKAEKFGMVGMIAAPATAALLAFDASKSKASAADRSNGQATVDATKAAALAGGTMVAVGGAIAKGLSLAVKGAQLVGPVVGKVAARAVPGLGFAAMAYGAVEGYRHHGVKGALLGSIGADALLDRAPATPAKGPSDFNAANAAFSGMQKATVANKGAPRGFANATVQAAAQAAKGHTFHGFQSGL